MKHLAAIPLPLPLIVVLCSLLMTLAACLETIPPQATNTPDAVEEGATENIGIDAPKTDGIDPAFDIVHAQVRREGAFLIFQQMVAGEVGSVIPAEVGDLAGAGVESYVWPTSLDSATVGFDADQGILALAVTAHPDFDDTPLVDENGDGDATNDGRLWHSHWVVLTEDETCGAGGLKVRDIPEGETPTVPDTWPELPLLIDSPNYELTLTDAQLTVHVPYQPFAGGQMFQYDGVAAGLKVNENLHAPLLCVTNVHDVASGDLSLPGVVQ